VRRERNATAHRARQRLDNCVEARWVKTCVSDCQPDAPVFVCRRSASRRDNDISAQGNALGKTQQLKDTQALKGRHTTRSVGELIRRQGVVHFGERACLALTGLRLMLKTIVPRALPWAGLLRPLRGKRQARSANLHVALSGVPKGQRHISPGQRPGEEMPIKRNSCPERAAQVEAVNVAITRQEPRPSRV
jgi:hypothetical protein